MAFLLFAGITQGFAQGAPVIKFLDTMQYDMGSYRPGEKAVHTFKFTNVGTADFYIQEVKTTCSCTATEWPQGTVAPGDTSSITVEFDTKDKQGEYAKGVNIFSNAGEINLIIMVKVDGLPVDKPDLIRPKFVDPHEGHNH